MIEKKKLKFNVGAKIGLGFAVMVALIVVLTVVTVVQLGWSRDYIDEVGVMDERMGVLAEAKDYFLDSVANLLAFDALDSEDHYIDAMAGLENSIQYGGNLLEIASDDHRPYVEKFLVDVTAYQKIMLDELAPLIRAEQEAMTTGDLAQVEIIAADIDEKFQVIMLLGDAVLEDLEDVQTKKEEIMDGLIAVAVERMNTTRMVSFIASGIALVIGILLTVFLTRLIRTPLSYMLSKAEKYAAGDFREEITIRSSDELGALAAALGKMQYNFKELVQKMQQSASKVNEAAGDLSERVQQTTAGVSETASTMNEIASTVDSIADSTQEVAGKAGEAAQSADKGRQGIETLTDQMQVIKSGVGEASTSLDNLSGMIGQIGQFVEVITAIAEQTNLLALNAAIEAARAGDAGRGFAVVAEEVRKLAEQSGKSAEEISQLIQDVNTQSQHSLQAMAAGNAQVEQGNILIGEVGAGLGEIINAVQELNGQVESVAAAVEEMTAGVENVAATTEEQTASMEESAAATKSLDSLANDLEALVAKFKV